MITKLDKIRFANAKRHAINRNVDWQLTLQDWHNWWQNTGHYHERGPFKDQYCMARYGDIGPYALDNIKCITNSENVKEARLHTKYYSGSKNGNSKGCKCENVLYPTVIAAAKHYGVTYQAVAYRLNSSKFKDFIWE